MKRGMDHKESLRFSLKAGVLVSAGDSSTDTFDAAALSKIAQADKVAIWNLADNYYDALRPDSKVTKRFRVLPGKSIHAEHGPAYYVETVVDGVTSGCMFDYGLDPVGVLNNIAILGLDPGKASAFGLSHGHFDHWMGAVEVLRHFSTRIPKGTPFYVGKECFAERYSVRPGSTEQKYVGQLKKEDIEACGLKVVQVEKTIQVIPGAFFTGHIERVTAYEKANLNLLIKRGKEPEPDDFHGEQALFFVVKGKGLVVLSGCAHRGIVNTVRQAQKAAGTDKVHAIMGGFHLIGAKPEVIQKTVAEIKDMKPDYVVPAHCTGFEAVLVFNREMPDQFTLNTAGTLYTFGGGVDS